MYDRLRPRKKEGPKVDPLLYASYVDDKESLRNIEAKFQLLEYLEKKNMNAEEAARTTFIKYGTPEQMPADVWETLDDWSNENDGGKGDENDDDYVMGKYIDDDDDDEMNLQVFGRAEKFGRRNTGRELNKKRVLPEFYSIERLGEGIELWPSYRVARAMNSIEGCRVTCEFSYVKEIISSVEMEKNREKTRIIYQEKIEAETLAKTLGKKPDAIVMDPPWEGPRAWNLSMLTRFIKYFVDRKDHVFISIWVTANVVPVVTKAISDAGAFFCDMVVVQLYDAVGRPRVEYTYGGLPQTSRSFIILRTFEHGMKISYQASKDTEW